MNGDFGRGELTLMKVYTLFLLTLTIFLTGACTNQPPPQEVATCGGGIIDPEFSNNFNQDSDLKSDDPDYERRINELKKYPPIAEAEADFKKGDRRIYYKSGMLKSYPGLSNREGAAIARKYGEIRSAGSTDAIEGDSHMRFLAAMSDFTKAYNLRKAALIQSL